MFSPSNKLIQRISVICLWNLSLLTAQTSLANQDQVESYFQVLANQNKVSPAETAGAHGISGWRLGLGLTQIQVENETSLNLLENQIFQNDQKIGSQLTSPKIWLTKGLFYPLDVGFTFSSSLQNQMQHIGGYAQWTVFEALATPALAIRTAHSRLYGLKSTTLNSSSLGLITSWGFRYISAFLGFNYYLHSSNYKLSNDLTCASLNEYENKQYCTSSGGQSRSWTESTSNFGIQINLVPPLMNLTIENIVSDLSTASNLQAKLSIGM